eukprot:15002128-Ditylum_brightwellii.AAC.1
MEIPNSTFSTIPLWPCYYMPKNPQDTLSQQDLNRYNHFQAVNTQSLEKLFLKGKHNTTTKSPSLPECHSTSLLDYVEINILKPTNSTQQKANISLPTVNKGIFSKFVNNLLYEALHRSLSHICKKKITSMCKQ